MWKPATHGETLFLALHDLLGARLRVTLESAEADALLEHGFLESYERFTEFTQLIATMNVFLRVHREVLARLRATSGGVNDSAIARILRDHGIEDVAQRKLDEVVESARLAADVTDSDQLRDGMKRLIWKVHANNCYLCGVALARTGNGPDKRSVDHIWPQALGGQSVPENLLPACEDCNTKKGHNMTWAWGPVQSTYESLSQATTNVNTAVRISLALASMMQVARGRGGVSGRKSLKDAAIAIGTTFPTLTLTLRRPYTYFELLRQTETTLP